MATELTGSTVTAELFKTAGDYNLKYKMFEAKGNMTAAQIDAITTPGICFGWVEYAAGYPFRGRWTMFITVTFGSTSNMAQIAFGIERTGKMICIRDKSSGTWGSWETVNLS